MHLRTSRPILFLILAVVCGCSDEVPVQSRVAEVTVMTLGSQPVTLRRELAGRLNASLIAEVRPQVTGIVQDRLFEEGGRVEAGQALYQLDDATYSAEVSRATANVARASAVKEKASANARRANELIKIKAISDRDYDDAVAALHEAEAEVKVAEAEMERAKVMLGYSSIKSPIAGRIGKSSVTRGALVTENQESALAKVQQLNPMYVDVTQSAVEYLELRKRIADGELEGAASLPVTIIQENGDVYPHPGKLAFSEVTVDPSTGSYTLRIVVENPGELLLPGMYVRAKIPEGVRQEAVLAPQQGILHDHGGKTQAMIVNADGKVEVREVEVSRAIEDMWLVESGLAAGDRIIVEGLQRIKPGMPVHISDVDESDITLESKH